MVRDSVVPKSQVNNAVVNQDGLHWTSATAVTGIDDVTVRQRRKVGN